MHEFLSKLREVKWPLCIFYTLMTLFSITVALPLASFLGFCAGTLLGIVIMGIIG